MGGRPPRAVLPVPFPTGLGGRGLPFVLAEQATARAGRDLGPARRRRQRPKFPEHVSEGKPSNSGEPRPWGLVAGATSLNKENITRVPSTATSTPVQGEWRAVPHLQCFGARLLFEQLLQREGLIQEGRGRQARARGPKSRTGSPQEWPWMSSMVSGGVLAPSVCEGAQGCQFECCLVRRGDFVK